MSISIGVGICISNKFLLIIMIMTKYQYYL